MSGTRRSVVVYGLLLLVSLGLAWWRWTREPEPDLEGKVVLLAGDADKIEKIVWDSDKDRAVIERRSDDHGDYLWVTWTKWEKPPAKPDEKAGEEKAGDEKAGEAAEKAGDASEKAGEKAATEEAAGEEAGGAEAGEQPERKAKEVIAFKAGAKGQDLLDKLSPMLAIRKLELDTPDKIEKAGLDHPTTFLEITRKGRTTRLEIGGEVYGTRDRYVRNPETGEVFLVADEVLRPLKYARTRLPDRTLWSFDKKDVATVLIENAKGESLEVEHKNPQDPKAESWVEASNPDEANEQLETWMDKAIKLKGTSYAKQGEEPQDLQLRFKLTLRDEKGNSETLEVFQEGDKGNWWGRSEHTRGLIKLLRGPTSSLADDVDTIVGAE